MPWRVAGAVVRNPTGEATCGRESDENERGNERRVVNALRSTVLRTSLMVSPTMVHLAGRVLGVVAELALTQMGVPGALACCEYLASWWQTCARRKTTREGDSRSCRDGVCRRTRSGEELTTCEFKECGGATR